MNKFQKYFDGLTIAERESIAKQGKTSVAYLSQIARGHRNPGSGLIDELIDSGRKDVVELLKPKWFADQIIIDESAA